MECITGEDRKKLGVFYEQFIEKYMGACDGKSTERIVNLIERYMGGKNE